MCLITVCPKGTSKNMEILEGFIRNGASSNSQGSGFAYKKNNETGVYINKGFFLVDDLIAAIEKLNLDDEDELIIHHRISTHGKVDKFNTHPFVVSEKQDEIIYLKGKVNKPVFAHNGIFSEYGDRNSDFSDTYHFCKRFLSIPKITNLLTRDPFLFESTFDRIIGHQKLVFLFPEKDKELYIVNVDSFTEDGGYYHSNGGYKSYVHDRGGSSWNRRGTDFDYGDNQALVGSLNSLLPETRQPDQKPRNLVFNSKLLLIDEFNCDRFIYKLPKNVSSYTSSTGSKLESRTHYYISYDGEGKQFKFVGKDGAKETFWYTDISGFYELVGKMIFVPRLNHSETYEDYLTLINYHKDISRSQIKKLRKIVTTASNKKNPDLDTPKYTIGNTSRKYSIYTIEEFLTNLEYIKKHQPTLKVVN